MNRILKNLKYSSKYAFTLAEILITLSIIGVIASMTIPALLQDVQDAQLKTAWKKDFSDLDQATKRIMLANGGNLKGVFADYKVDMMNKYSQYLNYTKICAYDQSFGNCWHKDKEFYTNTNAGITWENTEAIVLTNGNLLRFDGRNPASYTCSYSANNLTGICGWINVDVNGFKGPNKLGKDIFDIWILKDKVVPFGSLDDGKSCSSGDSRGCSAEYLYK